MCTLQARKSRLWLKTVISCQAADLTRITVYLFGAGRERCSLATPFVADAVISRHGPARALEGAPGPGGDNRPADRRGGEEVERGGGDAEYQRFKQNRLRNLTQPINLKSLADRTLCATTFFL